MTFSPSRITPVFLICRIQKKGTEKVSRTHLATIADVVAKEKRNTTNQHGCAYSKARL
jgi:hypothetical protein